MLVHRSASVKCDQPSPKELIYGDRMKDNYNALSRGLMRLLETIQRT